MGNTLAESLRATPPQSCELGAARYVKKAHAAADGMVSAYSSKSRASPTNAQPTTVSLCELSAQDNGPGALIEHNGDAPRIGCPNSNVCPISQVVRRAV